MLHLMFEQSLDLIVHAFSSCSSNLTSNLFPNLKRN